MKDLDFPLGCSDKKKRTEFQPCQLVQVSIFFREGDRSECCMCIYIYMYKNVYIYIYMLYSFSHLAFLYIICAQVTVPAQACVVGGLH